jgi:hypothetical protein
LEDIRRLLKLLRRCDKFFYVRITKAERWGMETHVDAISKGIADTARDLGVVTIESQWFWVILRGFATKGGGYHHAAEKKKVIGFHWDRYLFRIGAFAQAAMTSNHLWDHMFGRPLLKIAIESLRSEIYDNRTPPVEEANRPNVKQALIKVKELMDEEELKGANVVGVENQTDILREGVEPDVIPVGGEYRNDPQVVVQDDVPTSPADTGDLPDFFGSDAVEEDPEERKARLYAFTRSVFEAPVARLSRPREEKIVSSPFGREAMSLAAASIVSLLRNPRIPIPSSVGRIAGLGYAKSPNWWPGP